ncbi:MAG: hypothetical protein LBJ11_03765 [Oscillospiraceae bacterium]|jgi:hypothetical protein|nr:hypothetical protein [Oscillospiraceae bacterium]
MSEQNPAAGAVSADTFSSYKGHPLVRSGNTIYYGSLADSFVVCLNIVTTKKFQNLDVADKVIVQLVNTDPTLSLRQSIVQKCDRFGLFNAIDIGAIWLDRALKKAT